MKKIIYVLLVLVGGVLIASNLIVDSRKLDHKKVSASGTACKWISESGYGVGPYYVTENNISKVSSSNVYVKEGLENVIQSGLFKVLTCDSTTSGDSKDGNIIYNSSGEVYSGYIGYYKYSLLDTFIPGAFYVNNEGKIEKFATDKTNGDYSIPLSGFTSYNFDYANFNVLSFANLDSFHTNYFPVNNIFSIGYNTDVNSDGEFTFTCVCAEY